MEFDKSKVYTALNADEVKIGSRVIGADNIAELKERVNSEDVSMFVFPLSNVLSENEEERFVLNCRGNHVTRQLIYFVSNPLKPLLKWTDLKIGDVIKRKSDTYKYMVIGVDTDPEEDNHICTLDWISDAELSENWEKVEEC